MSSRRPKKAPPPDRPGGAYDDPPAPPANSASESLTPLVFFSFFVSFTAAAVPSVGNDASSFTASPRDGNAASAAGASSFTSSVCVHREKPTPPVVSQSSVARVLSARVVVRAQITITNRPHRLDARATTVRPSHRARTTRPISRHRFHGRPTVETRVFTAARASNAATPRAAAGGKDARGSRVTTRATTRLDDARERRVRCVFCRRAHLFAPRGGVSPRHGRGVRV